MPSKHLNILISFYLLGFAWNHPLAVAVGTDEVLFVTDLHRVMMINPNEIRSDGVVVVLAGSTST